MHMCFRSRACNPFKEISDIVEDFKDKQKCCPSNSSCKTKNTETDIAILTNLSRGSNKTLCNYFCKELMLL